MIVVLMPDDAIILDCVQGEVRRGDPLADAAQQTIRWIKAFNRLEAAISHHKKATAIFTTDADDALYAARDRILRDLAKRERE